MGAGGVIAALAVGGGAAYLLLRKKPEAIAPGAPTDRCASLQSINPTAYAACKAAGALEQIFGAIANIGNTDWAKYDRENRALNGDADIPLTGGVQRCTGSIPFPAQFPLMGSVLRFKNGCMPHVGGGACKPGTHMMRGGNGYMMWGPGQFTSSGGTLPNGQPVSPDGVQMWPQWDKVMTGFFQTLSDSAGRVHTIRYDPATGYFFPAFYGDSKAPCANEFPLAIPGGGFGGYYRGLPFVAPPGSIVEWAELDPNTPVSAPRIRAAGVRVTPLPPSVTITDGPGGGGGGAVFIPSTGGGDGTLGGTKGTRGTLELGGK